MLINQNGFREYDLNYVDANVRDTLITVAVNGSSKLDRDVRVDLAVNPDTLEGYNWEKYLTTAVSITNCCPKSATLSTGKASSSKPERNTPTFRSVSISTRSTRTRISFSDLDRLDLGIQDRRAEIQ